MNPTTDAPAVDLTSAELDAIERAQAILAGCAATAQERADIFAGLQALLDRADLG